MSLNTVFTDIANSIRRKDGSTGKIRASDFSARINSIPTSDGIALGRCWRQSSGYSSNGLSVGTYGNGKFIIASTGNDAMTSTNGKEWSTCSLPTQSDWTSLAFGNGKFVITAGAKPFYSTDGETWIQCTTGGGKYIAFTGKVFVSIPKSGSEAYYSNDGITWTSTTIPYNYYRGVSGGGGAAIAINDSSLKYLYTVDGKTWTEKTFTSQIGATSIGTVGYGFGNFIFATYNKWEVAYSSGGTTWTYLYGTTADWSIVSGGSDRAVVACPSTDTGIMITPGAVSCEKIIVPKNISTIIYGNDIFVAPSTSGQIIYYSAK